MTRESGAPGAGPAPAGLQELAQVVEHDARHLVPPPVAGVLTRSRRRRTRGASLLAVAVVVAVVVALGLGVRAWPSGDTAGTTELAAAPETAVLDEGVDGEGPWRLEVTEDECLLLVRPDEEGGACGFASPPRLDETVTRQVGGGGGGGGGGETLVAGRVLDAAAAVTITPEKGVPVGAELTRLESGAWFNARLPVVTGALQVRVTDAAGRVLDQELVPLLPPLPKVTGEPPAPPGPPAPAPSPALPDQVPLPSEAGGPPATRPSGP